MRHCVDSTVSAAEVAGHDPMVGGHEVRKFGQNRTNCSPTRLRCPATGRPWLVMVTGSPDDLTSAKSELSFALASVLITLFMPIKYADSD